MRLGDCKGDGAVSQVVDLSSTAFPSRRDLLLATMTWVPALGLPKSAHADPGDKAGYRINIAPVKKTVAEGLKARDEAMAFKCTGGMFDCDGDRREYAKKQYKDWLESGGLPKRMRNKEGAPRSY